MKPFTQILVDRLERMGIEKRILPGFVRTLANAVLLNPHSNLLQVNRRLHFLGWDDFELDYHTLQLAIASFEQENMGSALDIDHIGFKVLDA